LEEEELMDLSAQLAKYKAQVAEGTLTASEGKLRALKALLDAGVLSPEEFSVQKQAVLNDWVVESSASQVVQASPQLEVHSNVVYEFSNSTTDIINTDSAEYGIQNQVPQGMAWSIALVPIIIWFIELFVVMPSGAIVGMYAGLTVADRKELKDAGFYRQPHWLWGIFLAPVYLWKRATLYNQSREKFWVFIGGMFWGVFWAIL